MSEKTAVKTSTNTKRKEPFENSEAIKNLLILNLLKDGVSPKAIEMATNIPEMTIRFKFPMKTIKKNLGEGKNATEDQSNSQ